jgi:hypothetical protein
MHYPSSARPFTDPGIRATVLFVAAILLVGALPAFGQQTYVSRYDIFTGYTFLDSPNISLFENGFHVQAGMNRRTWYALGFDYSISNGDLTLTPDLLPTALQQTLGAQLTQLVRAGMIPANYQLVVPASSNTQTFAAGPQFSYRHFSKFTLFIRPSLGAIREVSTPKPADPIAKQIVAGLAPTGKKQDWTGFYGVGWGVDLNVSKHLALRVQADYVYDHLFNDILRDGRNTLRFSVGPAFRFGRNIVE